MAPRQEAAGASLAAGASPAGAAPPSDLEDIAAVHAAACAAGQKSYKDPTSGYNVFTGEFLASRGRCCGCGCRHCPYNHANVPMEKRVHNISAPALLHGSFDELARTGVDALFWSGGKDSFLAARALRRERAGERGRLLLVTTFDARSRTVAHQELKIEQVVRQAQSLGVPLLGVPLWGHTPYEQRIAEALALPASAGVGLGRLCSGDLHLEYVAEWRRQHIGPIAARLGATLHAPLWRLPYEALLADLLEGSGTPCTVCAVGDAHAAREDGPVARVGERFDGTLLARLVAAGCDGFGENGEFHTLVKPWESTKADPLA